MNQQKTRIALYSTVLVITCTGELLDPIALLMLNNCTLYSRLLHNHSRIAEIQFIMKQNKIEQNETNEMK